jgi:hypothetical protein
MASSGAGAYFRRLMDDRGQVHLRGDLSMLPGAGRFGAVEWFLYALLIIYIVELVVIVSSFNVFGETDLRSWHYLATFLGVAGALMVMLRYFISSISIAVLKREQDLAFKYVRTFRRHRLYPCAFFQFICLADQLAIANSTTVLLSPIASMDPDIDAACAPISETYLSANCTRSLDLSSLAGYVCSDSYYGTDGYRSAYDACHAARQQPLFLAQSVAALLLSVNAVLYLIFTELPQFSKGKAAPSRQGGEPMGQPVPVADAAAAESAALLSISSDGAMDGQPLTTPQSPFGGGGGGVVAGTESGDNVLRSQLRRLGKFFVMAALLVTPLWMATILVGARELGPTVGGSVGWSVRIVYSGMLTYFNLVAWLLSLLFLQADVVIRNMTGGWDVVARVHERLLVHEEQKAESAEVSRIKALAAAEEERGECTFTFLRASAVLALEEGTSRLPRFQDLGEDQLLERTISLDDIRSGTSHQSVLVVSHRWETPRQPDPYGKQLAVLREYLRSHPKIELVWFDYSCIPQETQGRRRTPEEVAQFQRQLKQVNMLFLGCECLCIVDMQYLGRFWTQLEAWLSFQTCEGGQLVPRRAQQGRSRTLIRGIHSAGRSIEEALEKEWAGCTWKRAVDILSRPDVLVTNRKDKGEQLHKIRQLVAELSGSPIGRLSTDGDGVAHSPRTFPSGPDMSC